MATKNTWKVKTESHVPVFNHSTHICDLLIDSYHDILVYNVEIFTLYYYTCVQETTPDIELLMD